MNKWIITKDKELQQAWDLFLSQSSNGVFLQSSYRASSYESLGFDWELMLLLDENSNIICGSANVIIGLFGAKLYLCSFGPTVSNKKTVKLYFKEYINEFNRRAIELHAFASQLSVPIDANINNCFKQGSVLQDFTSYKDLNIIRMRGHNKEQYSENKLMASFKKNCRRDIRRAQRLGLESKLALSISEIKIAYNCIELNASNKGYFVRSWVNFGEYIVKAINNDMAFMLTAWKDGEIQGALLLERSPQMLSYTMGGVHRNKPDLCTGYFLQFEAMKIAIQEGMDVYNISNGGSKSVVRFKEMFNPMAKEVGRDVYFIHGRFRYLIYQLMNKKIIKSMIYRLITMKKEFFK